MAYGSRTQRIRLVLALICTCLLAIFLVLASIGLAATSICWAIDQVSGFRVLRMLGLWLIAWFLVAGWSQSLRKHGLEEVS